MAVVADPGADMLVGMTQALDAFISGQHASRESIPRVDGKKQNRLLFLPERPYITLMVELSPNDFWAEQTGHPEPERLLNGSGRRGRCSKLLETVEFGRFTDEQSSRMDDLFALRVTLSTTGISGY
ncbi:hypothetical protein KCU93_g500, partial [Aureobasidium melanogenum]